MNEQFLKHLLDVFENHVAESDASESAKIIVVTGLNGWINFDINRNIQESYCYGLISRFDF